MAREVSLNQIIRFDGRNVFVEVLDWSLPIGKVILAFREYDLSRPKGEKFVKEIDIFMDVAEFETLAHDISFRFIDRVARKAREVQQAGNYKYCKEIYTDMGGTPFERLSKEKKATRPDMKDESRLFKITPGDKVPWILSAESGPGKRMETGLIAPDGKPDVIIRVPLSDKDFRKFAIAVNNEIQAWRVMERSRKERLQREERERYRAS